MDAHSRPPKLMDRVKATMRLKRYSPRTEKTYYYWVRYFIRFHGMRHPASMGANEVQAFLEHLAVGRHVAVATKNQAVGWKFKERGRYRPYPAEWMMVHIIPSAAVPEYVLIS